MRKDGIVKEFKNASVYGAYVMREKTNFLCGKMMDIEDIIHITYPYTYDELLGLIALGPVSETMVKSASNYSYDEVKKKYITIKPDQTQATQDANANTRWIFEFDSKSLLKDYLYNEIYTINPASPFKQIPLVQTPANNVSTLCLDYINANVMDRYRLKEFILYAEYYELKTGTVPGTGGGFDTPVPLLYKNPVFHLIAIPETNSDKNKETIAMKEYNDGFYEIAYKQKKSSQFYTFVYYYDVIFEKI